MKQDDDNYCYSEDNNQVSGMPGGLRSTADGFLNIPGHNPEAGDDSGLITSDSDFDKAAEKAGYNNANNSA